MQELLKLSASGKFFDYYSVYNFKPKAIDLRKEVIDEKTLYLIKENYLKNIPNEKVQEIKKDLKEVFPFKM